MSETREMTLDEWVNKLPDFHLVHKEYIKLGKENAELKASIQTLCDALDEAAKKIESWSEGIADTDKYRELAAQFKEQ